MSKPGNSIRGRRRLLCSLWWPIEIEKVRYMGLDQGRRKWTQNSGGGVTKTPQQGWEGKVAPEA